MASKMLWKEKRVYLRDELFRARPPAFARGTGSTPPAFAGVTESAMRFRPNGNDPSREGLRRASAVALSSASLKPLRVRRFAQLWLPPDARTALLRPR